MLTAGVVDGMSDLIRACQFSFPNKSSEILLDTKSEKLQMREDINDMSGRERPAGGALGTERDDGLSEAASAEGVAARGRDRVREDFDANGTFDVELIVHRRNGSIGG